MDQPPQSNEPPSTLKPTLPVEETPVIEPLDAHPEPVPSQPSVPAASPVPSEESTPETSDLHITESAPIKPNGSGCGKLMGNVIFFILLFGLGVWLSTQVRSLLAPVSTDEGPLSVPSPSIDFSPSIESTAASGSIKSNDSWTSYPLGSGTTEKGLTGVAYQLPNSVVPPVCDGSSCVSRGTNLPGGTRFTVAMRGTGYALPDFRGAILTDTTGKEFTMKQTTIGGKDVYEYVGNFSGRTSGGYSFTRMRGVLVPLTDGTSVDFNHFAPAGITSDFDADDALFNQIVARLTIPSISK